MTSHRIQCVAVLVRNIAGEVRSVNCIVGEDDKCNAGQLEIDHAAPREEQRQSLSGDLRSELIQEVSAAAVRDQLTKDLKLPARGLIELLRDSDDAYGTGDDASAARGSVHTVKTHEMIVQDSDILRGTTHQSCSGDHGVELLAEETLKMPCYPYVIKSWEFANDVDWGELSSRGTDACEAYVFQQAYESHVDFKNGQWNLTNVHVAAEDWAWDQCEELDESDIGWPMRIGLSDLYVQVPENDSVRWYYPTASRYASDEKPPAEALPLVKAMLGQYYKNTPEHIAEIMHFLKFGDNLAQCDSFLDLLGDEELKNAIARDVVFLQVTQRCSFHHMKKAPMELQEDVEFAFECLNKAHSKFDIARSFCSLRNDGLLRNNVLFAMECVKLFPQNLKYCGPAPLDTREVVLCALENEDDYRNPCAYYHLVSSRLRGDVEFVIEVIQKFGPQMVKRRTKQWKVEGLRDILKNTPNSVLQEPNVLEALDGRTEELGIESWRDLLGPGNI